MNFAISSWRPCGVAMFVLLVAFLLADVRVSRAEMRKSWQAKSAVVQTQLLKAARLEEPPSAKPPETDAQEVDASSQPPALERTNAQVDQEPQTVDVPAADKPVQFSSRVRGKYAAVKPPVPTKPIEEDAPSAGLRDRAVPLHLEPNLDEIQVDDATVQDDDGDEDDEDDEEDDDGDGDDALLGKEFDLIGNILEEVDDRVKQKKRTEEKSQPAGPSEGLGSPAQPEAPERTAEERLKEYTFPPVLNMTIDEPNNIVRVKLNQDVVRDMLSTGREGGGVGGKKMLRYILPLFILPFLIQSAVIPFMLTAVKLFLLKSLMAGKVAIFLLLLGAFKNFTKKEARDVYVKDVPDRRYEPSSEGFAYLAEGRPSGWSN